MSTVLDILANAKLIEFISNDGTTTLYYGGNGVVYALDNATGVITGTDKNGQDMGLPKDKVP